jgi:hypothetical protein
MSYSLTVREAELRPHFFDLESFGGGLLQQRFRDLAQKMICTFLFAKRVVE